MALIPTRPTIEPRGRLTLKPKEKSLVVFRAYAEMLQASADPDYVFDMLADNVLAKDPDFVKFLAERPDAGKLKKPGPKGMTAANSGAKSPTTSGANAPGKSLTNPLRAVGQ